MKYNDESCAIEIDVYELCSLALRGGDIGSSFSACEPDRDAQELYYRLQSEAGAYYNPDV